MGVKYNVNGHVIEFANEPSEQDIDEAAVAYGPATPAATPDTRGARLTQLKSMFPPTEVERGGTSGTDVALSTVEGMGKDAVATPAAMVNQYAAGWPKAVATSLGYKYPAPTIGEGEKSDWSGNPIPGNENATVTSPVAGVSSKLYGLTSALASPVNKMAAEGFLTGKFLPTVAGGALTAGATAGNDLQSSLDPNNILTKMGVGGATAGLLKGAGTVAGKWIPEQLKKTASSLLDDATLNLGKYTKYGASPSRELLAQDLARGSEAPEIEFKVQNRLEELEQKKNDFIAHPDNAKTTVNASGIYDPIDSALAEAQKAPETNSGLIKQLGGLRKDVQGIMGERDITSLPLAEADALKGDLKAVSKFRGSITDHPTIGKTADSVYGGLNDAIKEASPELGEIYGQKQDLVASAKALGREDMFGKTGKTTSLLQRGGVWTGLGAAGAAMSGHPEVAAKLATGAIGEEAAAAGSKNPWIRSNLAQTLYNTGEGITSVKDKIMAGLEKMVGKKATPVPEVPPPLSLEAPHPGPYLLSAPEPQGSVVNLPETTQTAMDAKIAELKKAMGVPEYGAGPRSVTPEDAIPKDVGAVPEQDGLIMEKRRREIIEKMLALRKKNFPIG